MRFSAPTSPAASRQIAGQTHDEVMELYKVVLRRDLAGGVTHEYRLVA
jgi:hypothetical protein